jgi:hypothetical protein
MHRQHHFSKQGAMEQIEDRDDAAPRPFDYADVEYDFDSKPKIDLGEERAESTDDVFST